MSGRPMGAITRRDWCTAPPVFDSNTKAKEILHLCWGRTLYTPQTTRTAEVDTVTASTPSGPPTPRLRADAARNRAQILAAARAAFRESGTAVPLDEIARRAGVNIATLYRRFPDRDALITQVVVDGFSLVLDTARAAAGNSADGPARSRGILPARHDRQP